MHFRHARTASPHDPFEAAVSGSAPCTDLATAPRSGKSAGWGNALMPCQQPDLLRSSCGGMTRSVSG
jgi:hypothetical protein